MRAIDSVLNQTWGNIELIVVDDASEDNTPELLAELDADVPVKIIRNKKPLGAAASRNIAIAHASGEYITGLDDDDYWMPNRIEKMMSAFEDGYSAVCTYDIMDYGNKTIIWKKKKYISFDDLLYYNQAGNQVLTKKEYIIEAGGFDEKLPSAQDYDLWIRLTERFGPIKTVPEALQVVAMDKKRDSITTSTSKTAGYAACFEKHRGKMSEKQIKYQQYRLDLATCKPVSWLQLIQSTPYYLLKKEITRKLVL